MTAKIIAAGFDYITVRRKNLQKLAKSPFCPDYIHAELTRIEAALAMHKAGNFDFSKYDNENDAVLPEISD